MPLRRDARVVGVDDDTFFVEAMLVLLPQLGLAPVACAMDGAEAIAVVREHDPDVVLVDLETPHVDGVEAIKEISRTSPNTTLLAVTGLIEPQRAADAVAAGALACSSKADVREGTRRVDRPGVRRLGRSRWVMLPPCCPDVRSRPVSEFPPGDELLAIFVTAERAGGGKRAPASTHSPT